jgi:hypothetical protein
MIYKDYSLCMVDNSPEIAVFSVLMEMLTGIVEWRRKIRGPIPQER